MRGLFYILSFMVIGALTVSCSQNQEESRHQDARVLFEKSLMISRAYTDSLKMAGDSAEVERLSTEYEEAINKLHFSFDPDLGLQISEGENDTLTNITLRFVVMRDSLLNRFARKPAINDSISDNG